MHLLDDSREILEGEPTECEAAQGGSTDTALNMMVGSIENALWTNLPQHPKGGNITYTSNVLLERGFYPAMVHWYTQSWKSLFKMFIFSLFSFLTRKP